MEAPTPLRDLHWTPLQGPGIYIYVDVRGVFRTSNSPPPKGLWHPILVLQLFHWVQSQELSSV